MEARILNRTGLEVSRVCLGTMTFGGQTDRQSAGRMLDCAMERGVNFLDTANVYNGGETERLLGELLGARRRSLVVASKVGMKVGAEKAGLTRSAILSAVENSLARLKTDYLDILYFHLPDRETPVEESLEAVAALVQHGKVRHLGTSNYASWQLCQMLNTSERKAYPRPDISQPMYNLVARRIEDEYLPMCKAMGVSTVAYNPLAGGLLTGKQSAVAPLPGTRFDGNKAYLDRYWNDATFAAVSRISELASSCNRSPAGFALSWLLHHSPIDYIILGASRMEHLLENLDACREGPLPEEVLSGCDEVWNMLRGAAPKYNR